MLIRSGFEIDITCAAPVPMLLALSTHPSSPGRMIGDDRVNLGDAIPSTTYFDRFTNRITRATLPAGTTRLWSDFVLDMDAPPDPVFPDAAQHGIHDLPDDVLTYLLPSRYCDSDLLLAPAWALFGHGPEGWARVQAITSFVHKHVTFGYQFGRATKTASEVFRERTGVCRDFAHLSIALCRAMNIPARYASGHLGDIGVPSTGPGDFCAWFEVYLGGAWHTFDARYNTPRAGRILMVRGADAGDVAMITSFGSYKLQLFKVWSDPLPDGLDDATLHQMLASRPTAEARVNHSYARAALAAS